MTLASIFTPDNLWTLAIFAIVVFVALAFADFDERKRR